jgi:hypothetical protein
MSNPNIREVGRVGTVGGRSMIVGVDYDSVIVGTDRLTAAQCEEFGRLFVAAVWQAGHNAALMAGETP